MDRHAHAERFSGWPPFGRKRSLGLEGRRHGIGRASERRQHAVALALIDRSHTAVVGDGGTDELVMPADGGRRRVWVLLPHPRRAFDVGQQEGDGACWQRRRCGSRRTRCWLFVAHRAGRHAYSLAKREGRQHLPDGRGL
jgi:hypothetical protein